MEQIENEIFRDKEMAVADANHYKIMKMIESEQQQLSPEYLQRLAIESFAHNTKLYFGDSIPSFLVENVSGMDKAMRMNDGVDGMGIL